MTATGRASRPPTSSRAALLIEVERRIAKAELRSAAQAAGIAALTAAGHDTTEAVERLYEAMDALAALRQQLCGLQRLVRYVTSLQADHQSQQGVMTAGVVFSGGLTAPA